MLLSIYPVNDMKFFIIKIHTHECKIKKKKKKKKKNTPFFILPSFPVHCKCHIVKIRGKEIKEKKRK